MRLSQSPTARRNPKHREAPLLGKTNSKSLYRATCREPYCSLLTFHTLLGSLHSVHSIFLCFFLNCLSSFFSEAHAHVSAAAPAVSRASGSFPLGDPGICKHPYIILHRSLHGWLKHPPRSVPSPTGSSTPPAPFRSPSGQRLRSVTTRLDSTDAEMLKGHVDVLFSLQ